MPQTIFQSVIELSTLNGANGFMLNGEVASGQTGYSVRGAGDINNDGVDDLIIGQPGDSAENAGDSYVVFGRNSTWNNTLELSSLNGLNGFSIDYSNSLQTENIPNSVSSAGDVNGDGIDDFIIGEPDDAGSSFVVFGKTSAWNRTVELSKLDGLNGFSINGQFLDHLGASVSSAGDINGDGISDIIIGAPQNGQSAPGKCYVVFGKTSAWTSTLQLSNLNGLNGFSINGEQPQVPTNSILTGYSVSGVGDINGDNIDDIVVGAPNAWPPYSPHDTGPRNQAGISYVVFGKTTAWNAVLELSSLNGTNGFTLNGEQYGDFSGFSVSSAGDINSDGVRDLIIGAYSAGWNGSSGFGRGKSYVVFGKTSAWNRSLELYNLNGADGFAIIGEMEADNSGWAVSSAGDFNDDGIDDILIGAPKASPSGRANAGKSYVVFGKTSAWNSTLELSSINGVNGFAINGNQTTDSFGSFVSSARDVNGDGINDIIIGAPGPGPFLSSLVGSCYVLFGAPLDNFLIHSNRLVIQEGEVIRLNSSHLNISSVFRPGSIYFTPSAVTHGRFELVSNPGFAISSFTQAKVWNQQVQFVHDATEFAPAYSIQVNNDGFSYLPPTPASITFVNVAPTLGNNQLTINEGQAVVLTNTNLSATDPGGNSGLIFNVSNVQHGQFELLTSPGSAITSFTQQQVTAGQVRFIAIGENIAPSYQVSVSDGTSGTTPAAATITFNNLAPTLVGNNLSVKQGQSIQLNSNNLYATDPGNVLQNLEFSVSNVQHGHFSFAAASTVPITQFSQGQLNTVQFTHDGTRNAPSYQVTVSDGQLTDGPKNSTISFDQAPLIVNNKITLTPGTAKALTSAELFATDDNTPDSALVFTVTNSLHGSFYNTLSPNTPINTFAQQLIGNGVIEFRDDGSSDVTPGYSITVSDAGGLTDGPSAAQVSLNKPSTLTSPQATTSNTVRNAIIGGSVSGVVGLVFFGIKFCLTRQAEKYLENATKNKNGVSKQQMEYQAKVVRPFAEKIFDRIKITGFLGYISDDSMKEFVGAIETLVGELHNQGVDIDLEKMSPAKQSRFLNEVARQAKAQLVPDKTCGTCIRFFKAEVTPQQIERKVKEIAALTKVTLQSGNAWSSDVDLEAMELRPK